MIRFLSLRRKERKKERKKDNKERERETEREREREREREENYQSKKFEFLPVLDKTQRALNINFFLRT